MDNNYPDSMPRMSDGRNFTSYVSNTQLNQSGQKDTSNGYRMNLTKHAKSTMAKAAQEPPRACNDTRLPEKTLKQCNNAYCTVQSNNAKGLGQGRRSN